MVAFLDLETTGLSAEDRVIEIAVFGEDNEVLFHSLVKPERPLTQRIKSITRLDDELITKQPKLSELIVSLREILQSHAPIVIYNQMYDRRFFPADFWTGIETLCALSAFREIFGNSAILGSAARIAGHVWDGEPHRAVSDARACRTVWLWADIEKQKMNNRFHNCSASEIAMMAFEAQQRMKGAEEDFNACKAALIHFANGGKLKLEIPQVCRVTVSEPPKDNGKTSYKINAAAFEQLEEDLRKELISQGVVEEREKSENPRSPVVRVSPL